MDRSYWDQLVRDLGEYIQDETRDAQYYNILAEQAPTPFAREIILEFSRDEAQHAANFKEAYLCLTGKPYEEQPMAGPVVPEYRQALKDRTIAETNDFIKYGKQYLMAPDPYLRNLFFITGRIEAVHAMRIPLLFEEARLQA